MRHSGGFGARLWWDLHRRLVQFTLAFEFSEYCAAICTSISSFSVWNCGSALYSHTDGGTLLPYRRRVWRSSRGNCSTIHSHYPTQSKTLPRSSSSVARTPGLDSAGWGATPSKFISISAPVCLMWIMELQRTRTARRLGMGRECLCGSGARRACSWTATRGRPRLR